MSKYTLRDAHQGQLALAEAVEAVRNENRSSLETLQATLLAAITGQHKPQASQNGNGHLANLPPANAAGENNDEESIDVESVLEIGDAADRPTITPPIDTGSPRPTPAGTFRLRRKSGSGGGSIDWSGKKGKTGIAASPAYDDTTRKVPVKVKDQKTGVTKVEEKTLNLSDETRNTVGPLLAEQYRTVEDGERTHASRPYKTIRLAQIDDEGKVIPGTACPMLFCTSESGSFMIRGELNVKATVVDASGKGQIVFSPVARGEVYLMGKSWNRLDK